MNEARMVGHWMRSPRLAGIGDAIGALLGGAPIPHQRRRRYSESKSCSYAECAVGLRVVAVAEVDWGKAQSPSRQDLVYRRATVRISSNRRG